jgi:hypothetical protein
MPAPFIEPPPGSYAYHIYTQFEWCQVRYVFARELTRPQRAGQAPLQWQDAYEEAGEVVKSMQAGGKPLAFGARPDELVWPTMLCYASRYSHMTPEDRAAARQALVNGVPIWMVSTVLTDPDLCDRAVLEDPEYLPYPPCVPSQVSYGIRDTFSSVAWGVGVLLIARTFVDASKHMFPKKRRRA